CTGLIKDVKSLNVKAAFLLCLSEPASFTPPPPLLLLSSPSALALVYVVSAMVFFRRCLGS
ncbi:hypothetical protein S83_016068, partial [Arachis hypogaea]